MRFSLFRFKKTKNDYYNFLCILDYSDNSINNEDLNDNSLFVNCMSAIFNDNKDIKQIILEYTNSNLDNKPNHEFILSNYDYIFTKNNKQYFFDIQYGLFDNIKKDGLDFLNDLLKTIQKKEKKDYINSTFWKKYNPFHIQLSDINQKKLVSLDEYIYNTKFDFEFINSNDDICEYTKYINFPINDEENIKKLKEEYYDFVGYTLTPKDEMDMIIFFLDALFSFDLPLILRKCEDEKCNKFFICKTGNYKKCGRVDDNGVSCSKRAENNRREIQRNDSVNKLEKKITDLLYRKTTKKKVEYNKHLEYEREYNEFKKENINNKKTLNVKEYVSWLLSYIKDGKKKEEYIKSHGLDVYLDK